MCGNFSLKRGVRRPRLTRYNLLLGLALLLVQVASAQNVTIDLTPITYPIVLPDSGGSFDYLLTVTNQGSSPITATVWCMATLPNGTSWGPVVGPATQTLGAGQTQGYYRAQAVPPRAPYGYYMLHAYVGIFPDTIWAQDQFEFQRQGISGTEQEWAARYNGLDDHDDYARAIAVDGEGNVYVTGRSQGISIYDDYLTIKYDAMGTQIWTARYNGPGNQDDAAYAIAVDEQGNVYVTGSSWGAGWGNYDWATIKYNSAGAVQWVARYSGPGVGSDACNSIAVDVDGNVYVAGSSYGIGTYLDFTTIKYNSAGTQQWIAVYDGPGVSGDEARSLALDDNGNVYVTGYSDGNGTAYDYVTAKYDAAGSLIWMTRYNGPGNGYDIATSLALDGSGNVYVTGRSYGSGTSEDYATIKYDAAGNQIWLVRYNGPANGSDEANSLAMDGGGNVYVTGRSGGSGTSYDYATIEYDNDGNQLWVARYNGPGNGTDEANCIDVDEGGNIYVTGFSSGIGTSHDYATISYNSSGIELWMAIYNGTGNSADQAWSMAINGSTNVYVTGWSHGQGGGPYVDYTTIKYSGGDIANWMPVEATVFGQPLPQECRLEPNYPNPFNSKTVARYELRVPSVVSLRVYDTAGRLVATLVDGWRSAGTHELTFDAGNLPSGMYFAKLEVEDPFGTGNYAGVQKLILLK